ncbi:BTB/POZ domain-containing protein 6-A-like [Amblyomma americanum]
MLILFCLSYVPGTCLTGQFNFKKFLQSGQYADVEFAVTPENYPVSRTFKGHRQLLALRNEVFSAMFYGPLAETGAVVIKDLHPDGFCGLLKYLYKGKPNIGSVEEAAYTRTAACKYLVPELELACTLYIRAHMKAEHVCRVIDCCILSGGGNIDDEVALLLEEDPEAVLSSDAFTNCLDQTVHYVLDVVTEVPEMCVLLAVHRWVQDYCLRSATKDDKSADFKTVMAPFLPKLRFLSLTVQEFVTFITSKGAASVISKEDAFDIMCVLVGNDSVELPSWVCREKMPR